MKPVRGVGGSFIHSDVPQRCIPTGRVYSVICPRHSEPVSPAQRSVLTVDSTFSTPRESSVQRVWCVRGCEPTSGVHTVSSHATASSRASTRAASVDDNINTRRQPAAAAAVAEARQYIRRQSAACQLAAAASVAVLWAKARACASSRWRPWRWEPGVPRPWGLGAPPD